MPAAHTNLPSKVTRDNMYISLVRSTKVEQLCPLGLCDPRTTGDAKERAKIRKFFSRIFYFEYVLLVNRSSKIDWSRSRIDKINSF